MEVLRPCFSMTAAVILTIKKLADKERIQRIIFQSGKTFEEDTCPLNIVELPRMFAHPDFYIWK